MNHSAVFLPGQSPRFPGPLGRYLAPLADGVCAAWLKERVPPGAWVLDPFGASPRLIVEAARSGYRVLAAVNNPIARFLTELYANPPALADLQAALAELASATGAGERLEPLIRELYLTECVQCGSTIEAQALIWDKDGRAPVGKLYTCPICKDSGERAISPIDLQRLKQSAPSGLHRARALERVAPLSDPDRSYAEEALSVYSPRAVFALFKLINRLDLLPERLRNAGSALLLAAFDQGSGLWNHAAPRWRPRQLILPARYLEKNVWLALESSLEDWSAAFEEASAGPGAVPLTIWPELPPADGGICLYEGRLKDLAIQIESDRQARLRIAAVLCAPPRPNQAYWTLSALWAGWLWGHAASGSFKSVLRRRRYDWGWHVDALSHAIESLGALIEPETPCLGLIGEAEHSFLSAALLAGEYAGLDLVGLAVRSSQEQAQIHWKRRKPFPLPVVEQARRLAILRKAMAGFLRQTGEPVGYLKVHSAALKELVQQHAALPALDNTPSEALRQIEDDIAGVLSAGAPFTKPGTTSRALETGQWWLEEAALQTGEILPPLADRVELSVLHALQLHNRCSLPEIDQAVCRELSGLFTPDVELVHECLASYGEQPGEDPGLWRLRPQDDPAARQADLHEMREKLTALGGRLGFVCEKRLERDDSLPFSPLIWIDPSGMEAYRFYLTASAILGGILNAGKTAPSTGPTARRLIVLPAGRSGLVSAKLRRDARLRIEMEAGWRFLKFRHVRLLVDSQGLSRDNLEASLGLDPLANRDPKMLLL